MPAVSSLSLILRLLVGLCLVETCATFASVPTGPNASSALKSRSTTSPVHALHREEDAPVGIASSQGGAKGNPVDESAAESHPQKWGRFAVRPKLQRLFGSLQPLIFRVVGMAGIADEDMKNTISHTLSWVTYGAVLLSAVGTLGVDIKPLLGLSTLAGFALSISAKNILSNTFSAAYVMWVRPFKRGDHITVCEFGKSDKYTGRVLSVDYHYVKLLSDAGKVILLPSHAVYGKVVELPG